MKLTFTLRSGSTVVLETDASLTATDLSDLSKEFGSLAYARRKSDAQCAAALNGERTADLARRRCCRGGCYWRDGYRVCDNHRRTKTFRPHTSAPKAEP